MRILPLFAETETKSESDSLFNIGYIFQKFAELFQYVLNFLENLFTGSGNKNF